MPAKSLFYMALDIAAVVGRRFPLQACTVGFLANLQGGAA
jgi:hypothetical protein